MFRLVLWKFTLLCVPVRFLLIYVAMVVGRMGEGDGEGRRKGMVKKVGSVVLGLLGLVIGGGLMYLHFSGSRPFSVAGDKAWWNRAVHSLFYLAFGVSMLMGRKDAYLILVGDLVYGIGSFVVHHVANGDFERLL